MEIKKISELPVMEEMSAGVNILVEENGETKRIAADKAIPDGGVKSVNGVEPDESGNVTVQIPEDCVKSVNGEKPDENGNVQVSGLPEGAGANMHLVTDAEGKAKWEERAFGDTRVIAEYSGNLEDYDVKFGPYDATDENGNTIQCYDVFVLPLKAEELDNPYQNYKYFRPKNMVFMDGSVDASPSENGFEYSTSVKIHNEMVIVAMWRDADSIWQLDNKNPAGIYFSVYPDRPDYTPKSVEIGCKGGEIKPLDEQFLPTTVPVIHSATVGQTVVVKAVDADGKPTEWEAVGAASGGGSPYIYVRGQMTDKEKLIAAVKTGAPVCYAYSYTDTLNSGETYTRTELLRPTEHGFYVGRARDDCGDYLMDGYEIRIGYPGEDEYYVQNRVRCSLTEEEYRDIMSAWGLSVE